MPLIPIGTEFRPRRPAYANWALIGLNVLVYVITRSNANAGVELETAYALDAARPQLYQYITYQFLHGDIWHLLGNMLFLWIFGHPVCATGWERWDTRSSTWPGACSRAWRIPPPRRIRWWALRGPSPR